MRKISASQNNSENKSSVGSVSGLAKTEQPQILPNHCKKTPEEIAREMQIEYSIDFETALSDASDLIEQIQL
ncbi:hypothetical protein [Paramuribaculum intestinale]|uniref:hypothetical protein n=1 Tax=Paramuribaculum intestinale TaxID=2094151 RepID=UPI001056EBC2|nr:hypothetical protein [Paramuribaculum intestinale]